MIEGVRFCVNLRLRVHNVASLPHPQVHRKSSGARSDRLWLWCFREEDRNQTLQRSALFLFSLLRLRDARVPLLPWEGLSGFSHRCFTPSGIGSSKIFWTTSRSCSIFIIHGVPANVQMDILWRGSASVVREESHKHWENGYCLW